ncbi:hypothetical protein PC116_g22840 [Phytophthora cactorum]|nr:hypothetical protein PC120_g21213 [Phytophthora cactorum]KAG4228816.1 hypothetical protein PC116_g22840 [Phytophthora cactorum]
MAIVRQYGKPDLLITVTTNPKWQKIQDNILPGQTASDRPDIVARETLPELYETVSACMIHGPCGEGINSPCIGKDGKCPKRLRKDFVDETPR